MKISIGLVGRGLLLIAVCISVLMGVLAQALHLLFSRDSAFFGARV